MYTRIATSIVLLSLVLGCMHTDVTIPEQPFEGPRMPRGSTILVGMSLNGIYENILYTESSRQTSNAISKALSHYTDNTSQAKGAESLERYLTQARASDSRFVIVPKILHWEDRATALSGMTDQLRVRLSVIEVSSGRTLNTVVLYRRSEWGSLQNSKPEDLLEDLFSNYIRQLFGG